jgi:hypothetical protein
MGGCGQSLTRCSELPQRWQGRAGLALVGGRARVPDGELSRCKASSKREMRVSAAISVAAACAMGDGANTGVLAGVSSAFLFSRSPR